MNSTGTPMVAQPPSKPAWLEFAYAAIDAGHAVFPLQGKVPFKGFAWRDLATTDKTQIYQWGLQYLQAIGYGIALGADDLVLDLDPRNYPQGRDVGAELITKFPELRTTRAIKTAGGGYHFYLKKPSHLKVKKSQSNYPGVDFLSEGNYAVGLGSSTELGAYSALTVISQIHAAPAELLAILDPPPVAVTAGADESLLMLDTFIAECKTAAPAIQGKGGDKTTLRHRTSRARPGAATKSSARGNA